MDRRTHGYISELLSYFDSLHFLIVTRHVRPTDFDYNNDAKHTSTFVVADLWQENKDELVLAQLEHLTSGNRVCK